MSVAVANNNRGAIDRRLKVLLWLLNHSGIKPLEECSVEEARTGNNKLTARLRAIGAKQEPMEEVLDLRIPSSGTHLIPVRLYRPRLSAHQTSRHTANATADGTLPVLVYMHGGGFVLGGLESLDLLCRTLAARTPCLVVSVDYRLAPEHPFPCGLEDCYDAAVWAAQMTAQMAVQHDGERCIPHSSGAPRPIALAGDSAGGNLATVVAQRARDTGAFGVCQQVLLYPVIDCTCSSASYQDCARGYGLTQNAMHWFLNHYLPDSTLNDERRTHPHVSPIHAELRGLPPTLIQTAAFDPLCDEGELYADALLRAGVPTTLTRYEGVIHGFAMMPNILPQARSALQEIVATLQTAFER